MSIDSIKEPRTFRGQRVAVIGLGIEGVDAVRFLHREGASEIVVSDSKPTKSLQRQIQELSGIPFKLDAGKNDPHIAEHVDAIIVSQGVSGTLPLLLEAERRNLPITSMMCSFLLRCPVPTIGITGSAGKSTTTSLVGQMFRSAKIPVIVGGNIGTGLLSTLDTIDTKTRVVLEISHAQLTRTNHSPHLGAVLNVTPNHLDEFTWNEYIDLKKNLLRHQTSKDVAILPTDNKIALEFRDITPADIIYFGLAKLPGPGATLDRENIVWNSGNGVTVVCPIRSIQIPGEHNLKNVLAATALGVASGIPIEAIREAICTFTGIEHRLETIATVNGVRYVDDSIATTPERTIAALQATNEPIFLLLGGREKKLPLETLAIAIIDNVREVICFGEAGPIFTKTLQKIWDQRIDVPQISTVRDLSEAVTEIHKRAQPGDVGLLSPAGTSFDAYENFSERGKHFTTLVQSLASSDQWKRDGGHGTH